MAPGTVARVEPNIKWFGKLAVTGAVWGVPRLGLNRRPRGLLVQVLCSLHPINPGYVRHQLLEHSLYVGNTRVIKQSSLQRFQEEMKTVMKDPYRVVMKQSRLPLSLLHDRIKPHVSGTLVLLHQVLPLCVGGWEGWTLGETLAAFSVSPPPSLPPSLACITQ